MHMRHHRRACGVLACLLLSLLTFPVQAKAGEGTCAHCGRAAACQKACRLVCEEKAVKIICWGAKHEDFCVPGPSHLGCRFCEQVCNEDTPGSLCVQPKKFVWSEWIPSCDARLHTRVKLMKKTVTRKVPSYKWVVEDLCAECEEKMEMAEISPEVAVPLPPVIATEPAVRPVAAR